MSYKFLRYGRGLIRVPLQQKFVFSSSANWCDTSASHFVSRSKVALVALKLELYTNLVFLVGIRLVFLGIYQTDTGGKLGRYISVYFFGGNPFCPRKGGHGPLFEGPSPHFEEKKGFPPNLKEFPPNSLVLKIPTEIPTDQHQY